MMTRQIYTNIEKRYNSHHRQSPFKKGTIIIEEALNRLMADQGARLV